MMPTQLDELSPALEVYDWSQAGGVPLTPNSDCSRSSSMWMWQPALP